MSLCSSFLNKRSNNINNNSNNNNTNSVNDSSDITFTTNNKNIKNNKYLKIVDCNLTSNLKASSSVSQLNNTNSTLY